MVGQVVEITDPGHWLKKSRGFLQVHKHGEQIGQVPLDDIGAVLISVPGSAISTELLDQLAQRNIPLVTCGQNYLPSTWTIPVQGAVRQFGVMQAQTKLSKPRRKRIWQQIVRTKINNQAEVLGRAGEANQDLVLMARKVRSGDPDNLEAQAARAYWQRLFGPEFRRDRTASGLNAALNYGYTVLRACVARGVVGAGLHPSFSVHHRNPQNPMNLVDDLLEPFRPIADLMVWQATDTYAGELTSEGKARLASLPTLPLPMSEGFSPVSLVAVRVCRAFSRYCQGDPMEDLLPPLPRPLHSLP